MDKKGLESLESGTKGCYIQIIRLPVSRVVGVGSLGELQFQAGYYAYVGSARGGLKARVTRHLRQDKKVRWHIDYLLQQAVVEDIVIVETDEPVECAIADTLSVSFPVIPKFGSSDCRCPGHLLYSKRLPGNAMTKLLRKSGFIPVSVKDRKEK